jgi:hypothetical protein
MIIPKKNGKNETCLKPPTSNEFQGCFWQTGLIQTWDVDGYNAGYLGHSTKLGASKNGAPQNVGKTTKSNIRFWAVCL